MKDEIDIRTEGGVQTIRFRRPDKKNAFTATMYRAMSAALDAGEISDDIAVHLFIGSGGSFSAGSDIGEFLQRSAPIREADETPVLDFIRQLPCVTKPMIAAVDGLAVGLGMTMLLHCDLVYATPNASLRAPFLDLGLVPEAASSLLSVERMGYARAFELLCLGEPFDAERARQAGIVNAIVPADELEKTALKAAARLANKPRNALLKARGLMRGDPQRVLSRIGVEADIFQAQIQSAEAREALAAFTEKRKPDFAKLR